MPINHDEALGFLDSAGHSRRFVRVKSFEEIDRKPHHRESAKEKAIDIKNKRIDSSVKYGKVKNESNVYKPLSISEQIRIASGMKQAIVKVTSYGKGAKHIMNHLSYISRNFMLELEDQNGALLLKKEDSMELISTWDSIYFDGRKNGRDTLHMIFSAPPETNRGTFKTLTREFLQSEFKGEHDYVFVQHDDTDHPHVHAMICLRSILGKKLDPRKEYLNQMRKRFSEKCREHGVMVDASRRFERGISGKSTRSELVHMRQKKQVMPNVDLKLLSMVKEEIQSNIPTPDTGELIRKTRNQAVKSNFYNTAKLLYQDHLKTPDLKKVETAQLLLNFSKTFPEEITRADSLKKIITNKRGKGDGFERIATTSALRNKEKNIDLDFS
jgi:hypothetical protein